MMKTTRRIFLLLLFVSVVTFVFTGCEHDVDITGPITESYFPDSIAVATMMQANPGMANAAEQFLLNFVANTRTESGCVQYDLYRGYNLNSDPNDRSYFILHEIWRDQAAIDVHLSMPYSQDLFAQAATYFVGGAFSVTTAEMDVPYPISFSQSWVVVFTKMTANPGLEETAVSELKSLVKQSRKEEGAARYDLYRGRSVYGTASLTMLNEFWRDWDAINYHMSMDYFNNFMAQSSTLFSDMTVVVSQMASTPEPI